MELTPTLTYTQTHSQMPSPVSGVPRQHRCGRCDSVHTLCPVIGWFIFWPVATLLSLLYLWLCFFYKQIHLEMFCRCLWGCVCVRRMSKPISWKQVMFRSDNPFYCGKWVSDVALWLITLGLSSLVMSYKTTSRGGWCGMIADSEMEAQELA